MRKFIAYQGVTIVQTGKGKIKKGKPFGYTIWFTNYMHSKEFPFTLVKKFGPIVSNLFWANLLLLGAVFYSFFKTGEYREF